MSFEKLMAATHRLCASMDALAALGAELRVRQDGLSPPRAVREQLHEIIRCVEPDMLADVTVDQEATALAIIASFFRQATDLLENPERPPGWSYRDPVVINGQGMTSRAFVRAFEAVAASIPDFRAVLNRPGTFLDVGTGAGLLAIEAARTWPTWRVVAIDRWEPALELARANIAASGVAERIELRDESVEAISDLDTFSLAWLPGPFLSADAVTAALGRIRPALIPGGWLVFSRFSAGRDPWSEAATVLKVVRNGGYPWKQDELESTLTDSGFEQVGSSSTVGSTVTFGRRPAP
jgi:SAM-dependent methyltransferase